jgi:hypothetical protein
MKYIATILVLIVSSVNINKVDAALIIHDELAISDGSNAYSFGSHTSSNWGPYFQVRYGSDLFTSDIEIETLRFYAEEEYGSNVGDGTYTLTLSTINSNLETDGALNLDSAVVVYSSTLNQLHEHFLDFFLDTTFLYNIADGDLLLSVTKTGGTNTSDESGTAFFKGFESTSVERLFGTSIDNKGLVIGLNQFGIVDVGEPELLSVIAMAFGFFWLRRRSNDLNFAESQ